MHMHASEQDRVSSFSHSAPFSGLKGSKKQSLGNKTQHREYVCPARAHGHFKTAKKAVEVAKYKTNFRYKLQKFFSQSWGLQCIKCSACEERISSAFPEMEGCLLGHTWKEASTTNKTGNKNDKTDGLC